MSDTRMDDFDTRLRKTEQVVFNGLRDSSAKMTKWLDEQAPKLMTREEHAKIDEAAATKMSEINREIGKKKDRLLVVLGIAIPAITVIALKIWESI